MSSNRLAVIITALPLERKAVLQHLRDVKREPVIHGSIYRRGVFDERSEPWDVVLAEIGAGNDNAAAECVRIVDHYSPQVAIFVGVAGALKDLKHGDVVASTKVYGYESGKDEENFKPRPSVQLSDYRLEQLARFEAGEKEWQSRIKDPLPREQIALTAMVGPIAAGGKLTASTKSLTYRLLRQHYSDAVAVEMEGHGFLLGVRMNPGTQGIIVRGISDLVDAKDEANDTKWQPIAAGHAAAFAFELLAKLPPEDGSEIESTPIGEAIQLVSVGDISGNNTTMNIFQSNGPTSEELTRLIQTVAPDVNAEIDAACAQSNAGQADVAIHMLRELRKKRWDKLSPRERYRIEANTGHAFEKKGDFVAAAKHFMEAKRHQPTDANALTYEAIAHYYLEDKPRAYQLAGDILKDHPNCALAVATRIRSAPPHVEFSELQAIVPKAISNEIEILHALGWRALTSGDFVAAEQITKTSLKHFPESVEIRVQLANVIIHVEGKSKSLGRQVNTERVNEAIEILTAAIPAYTGALDIARLRYSRAEAFDLQGKTVDAETDFRAAFDGDKTDPDVLRRFIQFLERHDRIDTAITLLLQADSIKPQHPNRLMLASLLNDRGGSEDCNLAISLLREVIQQNPDSEYRAPIVALLAQLMGRQNHHDEAISFLKGLDSDFLRPAVFHAIRASIFSRAGQKDDALACARQAASSLNAESPEADRVMVAQSLGFVGEKVDALKQWKLVLQPNRVDPLVCTALQLACEAGDDAFIMTFCKQLRAVGAQTDFTLELEVMTLEKYRMWDDALAVMKEYLASSPDDELARVFRVRMSLLGLRLDKPELVESDISKLPPVESVPVKIGAATAHCLRKGPHPERGVAYAYELVRLHFDDALARQVYVGIVGIGDDEYKFPAISTVA